MEAGPPQVAKDEAPYELPSRQRARTVVKVMIAVVGALLIVAFGKGGWNAHRGERARRAMAQEWGLDRASFERVVTIFERSLHVDNPDFVRWVEREVHLRRERGEQLDRTEALSALTPVAIARGVPRLAAHDVTDFHALRKRVAFASERACPCYIASYVCTAADTADGLVRLTDEELLKWTDISSRAAIAEARAPGPLPAPLPDFQSGLDAILERLDEPTQQRVSGVFGNPKASKDDLCFALRTIYTGAESLDEAAYVRFIRALFGVSAP